MAKVIKIDYSKCVGCRTCEMVCSLKHEADVNPFRSRIKVVKWEEEGRAVPMNCRQCEAAPCEAICPVKAISRDEVMGREFLRRRDAVNHSPLTEHIGQLPCTVEVSGNGKSAIQCVGVSLSQSR